jgi:Cytochrome oxidase complex assembly protein 1
MSTAQRVAPPTAAPTARKSWIARHKILTSLAVLVLIILVGFYFLGWPLVKWRFHSLLVSSLDEIRKNPEAVQRLGEPVSIPLMPLPSGRVYTEGDRGDARFDFLVEGPKDKAQAVAVLRMIDGKWGFTQLELEFPDKKTIELSQAIAQHDDNGTPKFDPNAKQPEVAAPNMPVDIKLPDLPEPPK